MSNVLRWTKTLGLSLLLYHLSCSHAGAQQTGEYWIDSDPGLGFATSWPTANGQQPTAFTVDINALGLAPGYHLLGFRAFSTHNGERHYSPTLTQSFYVPLPPKDEAQLKGVEYWIDSDPGLGLATFTEADLSNGADITIDTDSLDLTPGYHLVGFRAISFCGGKPCYGPTLTQSFYMPMQKGEVKIVQGEYFWNDDPGYGHGTPIAFSPHLISSGESEEALTLNDLAIPSHSMHGDATLFIRFLGTEGWSPTMSTKVMIDAEGYYTLNAQAKTSMETRNYQTLSDALADFRNRGVGNDITLTLPTKNTDYTLTVNTDSTIQALQTITRQMLDSSTARHQKTIAFTAQEGSGNTLTVSIAPETPSSLSATIGFFAQTSQENVALTINGTPYNFTPASLRTVEVCSGEETTPIALSTISTALNASWQAQPHESTVLSGFATEGTGDLPPMTIQNNGSQMDSIACAVTLSDTQGNALYSYTYYIYVHARMANQQFTGLSPAMTEVGTDPMPALLDPGTATLSWNPIGDATGGYRIEVSEVSELPAAPLVTTTTATSLEVPVESGHHYQWTVTAVCYCDELVSPTMLFEGRLLPDLAVTAITLPEAAQAGNTLTVVATVTNQGEGATTEKEWTDRLYYVIDSEDFAQAVFAAEAKHTGNLASDDSYEQTFQMTVPYEDAGLLRVFVETNADGKVLESNAVNNRHLSPLTSHLSPFYMNKGDLAALRQLYTAFDGENWNGTRWDASSELVKSGNWSGVTFDDEGCVTAINLQGRGLSGSLSHVPYVAIPSQQTEQPPP